MIQFRLSTPSRDANMAGNPWNNPVTSIHSMKRAHDVLAWAAAIYVGIMGGELISGFVLMHLPSAQDHEAGPGTLSGGFLHLILLGVGYTIATTALLLGYYRGARSLAFLRSSEVHRFWVLPVIYGLVATAVKAIQNAS